MRGRPKKHETDSARVKAYRNRKNAEGRRLDIFVKAEASWRLTKLAAAWECSKGQVIERLIMEADERYEEILFPETKY
ncbi:MAG: hypothetical protein ACOZF0_22820 [Thermodesulfobacteriota bacterium]